MNLTENGKVIERIHTEAFGNGAAVKGKTLRAVGIHQARFRIERMFMNKQLFIGIKWFQVEHCGMRYDDVATVQRDYYNGRTICGRTPASGWFGNNSIGMYGNIYDGTKPAPSGYDSAYEQYYTTNDVVTLTINCEEATLILKNERTQKEYRMVLDVFKNLDSRLPWILYVNLYYPGDKLRLLPPSDS